MWNRPYLAHSSILNELYPVTSGIFLNVCHSSLGFRFEKAQEKIHDYEDTLEEAKETQKDTSFETIYEEPHFTRLKPDSTYRI